MTKIPGPSSGRPIATPDSVLVVLGASNVARGLPWLVRTASEPSCGIAELLVAGGHGRSYGLGTRVLGRSLPGILECGLWSCLERLPNPAPIRVVLADIGNDLMYGVPPDRLVSWVESCLERIPREARVTIVAPPLATLASLSSLRFQILRTLFFPTRRVGWIPLRAAMDQLAGGLRALACDRGVGLLDPPAHWYGLDPIHTRLAQQSRMWRCLLAGVAGAGGVGGEERDAVRADVTARDRWRFWTARPESWALLGTTMGRTQPCARLDGGMRLWMY
ncbi:MAG TPA: hypothetical protein VNB06_23500 [Thermoanaerobaculia bacterium]|nr:hypothetical protein [Thermoanaerobaculia bacterium]